MSSKRDMILSVAVDETARSGVRGLRVDDVAAAAGVSKGLVHYYLGGRAKILTEIFASIHEQMQAHNERVRAAGSTARERLRLSLLAELEDTPEVVKWSAAWSELLAAAQYEKPLRAPLARWTGEWHASLTALVEDVAREDPGLDLDADAVAERLATLCEALCTRWLSGSDTNADVRAALDAAIDRELSSGRPRPLPHAEREVGEPPRRQPVDVAHDADREQRPRLGHRVVVARAQHDPQVVLGGQRRDADRDVDVVVGGHARQRDRAPDAQPHQQPALRAVADDDRDPEPLGEVDVRGVAAPARSRPRARRAGAGSGTAAARPGPDRRR